VTTARSVQAAQAVARAHGVACDAAVPLAAGSNVLVHLKPAPVVARVMTGTGLLHDDHEQWLAREVAVGVFLAARNDLIVPPTDLLPPGPHRHDGLWMTMWQYVPHAAPASAPDPQELGRSLRALHAALADFPGELAPLSGIRDWLAQLSPSAELTRQLEALTPVVFESSLAAQALHGDVSIGNLLRTDSGPLWNDLEDVCTGPVEWDVAGLVASVRARGHGEAFIAALLDAYGQVEDLAPFLEAHALYETIWRAFDGG
jgi:phosphotransferase family enzyme